VVAVSLKKEEYLRYAIPSVREQDDEDWELVVSDNCSADGTEAYIASLDDPRIVYVRTSEPLPVTENWQFALDHSTGDYVLMLGDDDCLLRGYFRITRELVRRFDAPEVIYHGAYQFAYPGVMPGAPDGYLIGPHRYGIFGDESGPFVLHQERARAVVDASMQLRMLLGYNMQYTTVSRSLIERIADRGPFYQSPYPDFYATNVLFLAARSIVCDPRPLVAIGICPKSFGAFFFSDRESEGVDFLMNAPDPESQQRLKPVLLPGLQHYTSWLFAMEFIRRNYGDAHELSVGYRRYRTLQITHAYRKVFDDKPGAREQLRELKRHMRLWERLLYGVGYALAATALRVARASPGARWLVTAACRIIRSVHETPGGEAAPHHVDGQPGT
jgi:glycosyltransferase involved in cell wall biosynthesis